LEEIELILLPLELPEIIQMKIYSFINSLSFLLKVMEVHKYNSNTREAKVGVSQVQGNEEFIFPMTFLNELLTSLFLKL
jgi:hypothetical protein